MDSLSRSHVTMDTATRLGSFRFLHLQSEGGRTLGRSFKFLLAPKFEDSGSLQWVCLIAPNCNHLLSFSFLSELASICPLIHPSVDPHIHPPTHPSTHPLTHPLTHPFVDISTQPPTPPPIHKPIHPLTHPPTHNPHLLGSPSGPGSMLSPEDTGRS